MFDRQRIESSGLTYLEIAVIGCASAVLMLLSACVIGVFCGRGFWTHLLDWATLRDALGVGIGLFVFVSIARWLNAHWFVQLIVIVSVASGLGQLLALLIEVAVRWLLSGT